MFQRTSFPPKSGIALNSILAMHHLCIVCHASSVTCQLKHQTENSPSIRLGKVVGVQPLVYGIHKRGMTACSNSLGIAGLNKLMPELQSANGPSISSMAATETGFALRPTKFTAECTPSKDLLETNTVENRSAAVSNFYHPSSETLPISKVRHKKHHFYSVSCGGRPEPHQSHRLHRPGCIITCSRARCCFRPSPPSRRRQTSKNNIAKSKF